MNSKERVSAAILRQPVDKVPLGFYVADWDVISRVIGRESLVRNKPAIQLAIWQGRRDELVEQFKEDIVDFYTKLNMVDIISYKEAVTGIIPKDQRVEMPKKIGDDTYEFKDGRIFKLSYESNDVACVYDPTPVSVEYGPEDFPLPDPSSWKDPDGSRYEVFDHLIEVFGKDRYLLGPSGGLGSMPLLGGMENGLMLYALCPEAVAAAARQNGAYGNLRDIVHIRPGSDGVMLEEDLAGSNGMMISPDQWREIGKPVLVDRVKHIKKRVSQVVLHNCGRNVDILPDIAEAGVDCYQSLQSNAGMGPEILLPEYGHRLSFWGGAPVELLVGGSAREMEKEVRRVLSKAGDLPGFIYGPSHSIAFGTRYDNFMAMLEVFDQWR